jgi:enoyl-CoA hydratase
MTAPTPAPRHQTGTDRLLLEVTGHVATVIFNNPGKRNALSVEMRAALPGLLSALNADNDVRAIVMNDAWASLDKPVIAMIRGFCMGGGLLTALQADIRIASDDSQFGIPAARLGLGYGVAGVTALMNLIGPASTAEILFSAGRFTATQALRMGLVNQVVPADSLDEAVLSLTDSIARNAPLTVAAAKAAIRAVGQPGGQRDLARAEAMVEACFLSADYLEGQRAFAEKRPPAFTGR